jgi:hypothetical protein
MGLAVDEDGTDSPSPPPLSLSPSPGLGYPAFSFRFGEPHWSPNLHSGASTTLYTHASRKRQFDVASLLAPDNDDQTRIESMQPSKRVHLASSVEQEDEDIDVVANDDAMNPNETNSRRLNEEQKSTVEDNLYSSQRSSWNSIAQHLPLGINTMDPRFIGRCYGQYMAHHQIVNKRLFNSISFNPNQTDEANKFIENSDHLVESGKRDVD